MRGMAGGSLSEDIRARARTTWDRAVGHRLFREIAADEVGDAAFQRYLQIEFGFIDTAAAVMGYAIARAPDLAVRQHLSAGLHALTTDQVAFFKGALGPEARAIRPKLATGLHDHFMTVARDRPYVEIVTCMLAAEWLYATWCGAADRTPSARPAIADWVALHAAEPFIRQVEWMRTQLEAHDGTADRTRLTEIFTAVLEAEIRFHDAAYDPSN